MVFNAQFINDCARTQFTYVLMWFSRKRERTSDVKLLRQLLKLDFAIIHVSRAHFQKPVSRQIRFVKRVTWQLSSNSTEFKRYIYLARRDS